MTPVEACENRKEEINGMKKRMGQHFTEAKKGLEEAKEKQDTEQSWNLWSKAVEEAYIKALEVSKETEKALRGRGKIMLTKKCRRHKSRRAA